MRQVTTEELSGPATAVDAEVLEFRSQFGQMSPLDELVRHGAQQMLQTAIEAEVDEFLSVHAERRDARGNRLVVRNGYQPAREILTGAGRLAVAQPRVRDNSREKESRVRFSSKVLPPYLRRSKSIDELIPWLYLKGISTGDFAEALQALVGEDAPALSPNVVVRLSGQWSQEYDEWSRRDLSEKQYVYVWADGIHVNVRLENEANQRQCLLVLMGATADGLKELIAVVDGYRDRGLGGRLMLSVMQAARDKGLVRIALQVRADNTCAIALYERLGFRHEGRLRRNLRIDGIDYDSLLMAHLLDEAQAP